MAKPEKRAAARGMRHEGASLRQIAMALDVSLASASTWTRDVRPPAAQRPAAPKVALSAAEEPSRPCARCEEALPVSAFNRSGSGHQAYCRPCFRSYRDEDIEHHRATSAAGKRRRIARAQEHVDRHLLAHACTDCGEADAAVLEFDHVGPKQREISVMVNSGCRVEALKREISSCEVVCCNSHRRRTALRAGWRRADPERCDWRSRTQERNFRFAWSVLSGNGCMDCGAVDLVVLDFDHVVGKTENVMKLARSEVSLRRLDEEIERCVVLCANCHRRKTRVQLGYRARGIPPARIELALTP